MDYFMKSGVTSNKILYRSIYFQKLQVGPQTSRNYQNDPKTGKNGWDTATILPSLMGYPMEVELCRIFVNLDWFDNYGVKPPESDPIWIIWSSLQTGM